MNVPARFSGGFWIVVGLILWGVFELTPAMAATITYNFSGTVNHVGTSLLSPPPPSPPFGTSGPSSAMSGSITVNTLTPDTDPSGVFGNYSIHSFQVTIGSYTATYDSGSSGQIVIRNGSGSGVQADRFIGTANFPNGAAIGLLAPRLFKIDLRGDKDVFPNDVSPVDKLPGTSDFPPSISDFNNKNEWRLVFGPGSGDGNLNGQRVVSGIVHSIAAVPLPAAVILFGVGLVALIGLGAGGLRNMRLPEA